MSFAARQFSYKSTSVKSVTLMGGGKFCGRIYNACVTEEGAVPRYMPEVTGYGSGLNGADCGYVSSDGTMFIVKSSDLYCKQADSGSFSVIASGLKEIPFFAEYTGGILISDGTTDYTYSDSELGSVASVKSLYGGVLHYDRLFGADLSDGYIVRWTAAGSVDDWSEGIRNSGWLRLSTAKGKVLQLIPFKDKLIAVRENGLSVIRVYGETENIRISSSDTITESVIAGTAAVCAGKLFFATCSGIYSYDGTDTECKVQAGTDGTGSVICAVGCGNYYFASMYLDGGKVLACINGESGEISYCKISADCIFAKGKVYFVSSGKVYALTYPAYSIDWNSGYTDFGESGSKFLKSVYIDCADECTLTVESSGVSRIFTGVTGKITVKMSGEKFRFKLNAPCKVASVTAVYES